MKNVFVALKVMPENKIQLFIIKNNKARGSKIPVQEAQF